MSMKQTPRKNAGNIFLPRNIVGTSSFSGVFPGVLFRFDANGKKQAISPFRLHFCETWNAKKT